MSTTAPAWHSRPSGQPGTERLLNRLDGVRGRGARGWTAKCPAHPDKHASLSVSEVADGKILVHCFAGCTALEVVQACGLELADLFPERLKPSTPEERRLARQHASEARWMAAARVLNEEAAVSLIAAKMISQGKELTIEDIRRLSLAYARIDEARETLNGR